jgi:hypothetical protein
MDLPTQRSHRPFLQDRGTKREDTVNDKREITGWMMYDWANSAFSTTVVTALLGPYIQALAEAASEPFRLFGTAIEPGAIYPAAVSLSVILQVFFLPLLGTIADYTHLKKRMLLAFAYTGAFATILLFFVRADMPLMGTRAARWCCRQPAAHRRQPVPLARPSSSTTASCPRSSSPDKPATRSVPAAGRWAIWAAGCYLLLNLILLAGDGRHDTGRAPKHGRGGCVVAGVHIPALSAAAAGAARAVTAIARKPISSVTACDRSWRRWAICGATTR